MLSLQPPPVGNHDGSCQEHSQNDGGCSQRPQRRRQVHEMGQRQRVPGYGTMIRVPQSGDAPREPQLKSASGTGPREVGGVRGVPEVGSGDQVREAGLDCARRTRSVCAARAAAGARPAIACSGQIRYLGFQLRQQEGFSPHFTALRGASTRQIVFQESCTGAFVSLLVASSVPCATLSACPLSRAQASCVQGWMRPVFLFALNSPCPLSAQDAQRHVNISACHFWLCVPFHWSPCSPISLAPKDVCFRGTVAVALSDAGAPYHSRSLPLAKSQPGAASHRLSLRRTLTAPGTTCPGRAPQPKRNFPLVPCARWCCPSWESLAIPSFECGCRRASFPGAGSLMCDVLHRHGHLVRLPPAD